MVVICPATVNGCNLFVSHQAGYQPGFFMLFQDFVHPHVQSEVWIHQKACGQVRPPTFGFFTRRVVGGPLNGNTPPVVVRDLSLSKCLGVVSNGFLMVS